MKTLLCLLPVLLCGCARFSSYQTQTRTDGTIVTQRQSVTTLFDGKSEIAKLRASSSDKTTGLTVGSLSEEGGTTNGAVVAGEFIGAIIKNAK